MRQHETWTGAANPGDKTFGVGIDIRFLIFKSKYEGFIDDFCADSKEEQNESGADIERTDCVEKPSSE